MQDSFKKVPSWLEEIDKVLDHKNAKLLVGNKSDLERERSVSYEKAMVSLCHHFTKNVCFAI